MATAAWKIAPALAFGNAVIWKPADLHAGERLGACRKSSAGRPSPRGCSVWSWAPFQQTGRRLGGSDRRPRDQLHRIVPRSAERSPPPQTLSYVKLPARDGLRKNPLVVMDDADLDRAVDIAINGNYVKRGQNCTASSRLIVHQPILDALTERFIGARAGVAPRQRARRGHADGARRERSPACEQSGLCGPRSPRRMRDRLRRRATRATSNLAST